KQNGSHCLFKERRRRPNRRIERGRVARRCLKKPVDWSRLRTEGRSQIAGDFDIRRFLLAESSADGLVDERGSLLRTRDRNRLAGNASGEVQWILKVQGSQRMMQKMICSQVI